VIARAHQDQARNDNDKDHDEQSAVRHRL
jgi:hypothetical protein